MALTKDRVAELGRAVERAEREVGIERQLTATAELRELLEAWRTRDEGWQAYLEEHDRAKTT